LKFLERDGEEVMTVQEDKVRYKLMNRIPKKVAILGWYDGVTHGIIEIDSFLPLYIKLVARRATQRRNYFLYMASYLSDDQMTVYLENNQELTDVTFTNAEFLEILEGTSKYIFFFEALLEGKLMKINELWDV